jgi:hypothetical protein
MGGPAGRVIDAGSPAWQVAADVLAAFLHTVPVGCHIPDGNPKP